MAPRRLRDTLPDMFATVLSSLVRGLEGRLVEVQVDVAAAGMPGFLLVGLAGGSVREAKERVRSAIRNSGLTFPPRRLTVNLAPAELPKDGSGLDLAIAVGICLAELGLSAPRGAAFLGELALDGGLRHVDGVLVAARWLVRRGHARRSTSDESDPGPMPVSANAPIEGDPNPGTGDRHVLVIDKANNRLYELYNASKRADDTCCPCAAVAMPKRMG